MLSRDTILDAGAGLIEEDGLQGLTMRRLAERLNVTATALYHYFRGGREELLEALLDRICAAIVAETPAEGRWTDRLRILLTAMVERSLSHPSAVVWSVTAYARRPPVLRLHEAILEVLEDGGFTLAQAMFVKGSVLRYCVGHLVLGASEPGPEWHSLPGEQFQRYREARARVDFEAGRQFRSGLDALLAGLEDTVQPGAPVGPSVGQPPASLLF